ncbi:MAG: hypothetical protein HC914_18560 [Chloroflexaceae bacterium]|nr:hypothetical protein [Chloroflexaceae bacterium]
MNQVALRRLIGGSVLIWVVCTVVLMTHPVPPQQRVGAQAAPTVPPTAAATAEVVPEQLARPVVYLPLIQRGQGTAPTLESVPLPDSAATARYARWNWDEFGMYDIGGTQRFVPLAYKRGYDAVQGSPESTIILGFGSQLEPGRVAGPSVRFDGVTSENAGSFVCGILRSLTWQQSWEDFYQALNTINGLNASFLKSSVSSFYLPPRDEDMP